MTPINNYYGTHAGGSRGVDVWLGWSVASECQGRFLRRVRGYSHPSHRSSPNLPNEIFGECSWTSRMKIYWLYVGLGPYAKNCILVPTASAKWTGDARTTHGECHEVTLCLSLVCTNLCSKSKTAWAWAIILHGPRRRVPALWPQGQGDLGSWHALTLRSKVWDWVRDRIIKGAVCVGMHVAKL